MNGFWIALIMFVVSPFLYVLFEIARNLRRISDRLKRAEFEFDVPQVPQPPQIKSTTRRQLKT